MEARFRIDGKTVDEYNAVVDYFGLAVRPAGNDDVLTFLDEAAKFTKLDKRRSVLPVTQGTSHITG